MTCLTRIDYTHALELLARMEVPADDAAAFAQRAVTALVDFLPCEFATLSVCDLCTGHRQVMGQPGIRFSAGEIAAFDHHFFEHPLVRFHGLQGGRFTHRVGDSVGLNAFRNSALYADYYRVIGIQHVMAMPLAQSSDLLVSIVFNRARREFSDRDRERLELLRPHLSYIYRQCCARSRADAAARGAFDSSSAPPMTPPAGSLPQVLTQREVEVLHWVAAGKTDKDIATLLGVSARTINKHLEHVYIKLGVETRTAAVMRAMSSRWGVAGAGPARS